MARKEQNFEIWQGDHKRLVFEVEDVDDLIGSTAIWKAGETVRGPHRIRKEAHSIEGKSVEIRLNPEDTLEIPPSRYYHELEITDGSGKVVTAAIGQMRLFETLIG